jgi:predicted CopG family antitoxin
MNETNNQKVYKVQFLHKSTMAKRSKTFSIDDEVYEALKTEKNMSVQVNAYLRQYFELGKAEVKPSKEEQKIKEEDEKVKELLENG